MNAGRLLLLGALALGLAACGSDPYPDMHLEPRTPVALRMDPGRISYGRLQDVVPGRAGRGAAYAERRPASKRAAH